MQTLNLTKKYEKYPEYKDSGVDWLGKIPKEWEVGNSRRIFNTDKERVGSNFADYKILSLTLNGIIPKVLDGSGKNPAEYDTYQVVKKNDLIFCLFDYDVTPRTIGYVEENGMITGAYTRLMPRKEISSKYFYYYFLSLDYTKELLHLCTGLRSSISKPLFWSMKNPLPDIKIQNDIANYLDEKTQLIDEIIEKKEKLIELLKEKRTAVINNAVTNFDKNNIKNEKIKHLVLSIESGIWGENQQGDDNDIKCLRVADFDYENFSFNDVKTIRNNLGLSKQKILQVGDILMEKSGGGEKTPVGRAILFDSNQKMVCANFVDIVRVDKQKILPKFLVLILSVLYSRRINTKYIKQNTGIQNIDIKNYFGEMVSFPEIETQRDIIKFTESKLSDFKKSLLKIENSIELLKEFKTSLISNVVTGKIKIIS
jgi:type I restriction enzyme S subunit